MSPKIVTLVYFFAVYVTFFHSDKFIVLQREKDIERKRHEKEFTKNVELDRKK